MTLRCLARHATAATVVHRALLVACITLLAQNVAAQSLAINGVSPPGTVVVAKGSTVSVSVTGGPGVVNDWVGVYAVGTTDQQWLNWRYLNGTQTLPPAGLSNATFGFPLPATAGDYEFRFFTNNWTRLAVSGVVTGAPPPTITSVTPSSGHVGDVVTINGTNFRATQNDSVVTFNGTAATLAYWSSSTLTTRVPTGATTGSIIVTVLGAASNGSSFTVTAISQGTIGGTITRATGGSAISGATVEARLAGVLEASATTAGSHHY